MDNIKITKEQAEKLESQVKRGILINLYNSKLLTSTQLDELLMKIK